MSAASIWSMFTKLAAAMRFIKAVAGIPQHQHHMDAISNAATAHAHVVWTDHSCIHNYY